MSSNSTGHSPAFLEQQRGRLAAMRDELVSSGSTRSATERTPKGGEAKEIEDDAQDLAQSEIDGTVGAVEERRLRAIERALAKIDEGTYGLSDLSGDPIPKARLEAMPEAVLTIQEEQAREKQRRQ
jgi:DnaK suppressor protein